MARDPDDQPGAPWETYRPEFGNEMPDSFDRARGREAIAQIRETLANAKRVLPVAHQGEGTRERKTA